jgi:hypothetical protein
MCEFAFQGMLASQVAKLIADNQNVLEDSVSRRSFDERTQVRR